MKELIITSTEKGHICPHQIGFMLDNPFRRIIQSPKKITGEYINQGDTVIDMGCGPGYFTIDMARMVGDKGKVIAVDLQVHMLNKVKRKAKRHGVFDRMEFHQCEADKIGLNKKADFILAYYMIHETPDPKGLLTELMSMLNEKGKILIVEPKIHVGKKLFETMLQEGEGVGLRLLNLPKGKGGRSVLFGKK